MEGNRDQGSGRVVGVEVDGLDFDVRIWGTGAGTPVVLLHGFPQTSASWTGVAEALLAGRDDLRLLAPDQRGYSPGARPADVAVYGVDRLGADVLEIVAALGHDRFHLVGHDWGASVAWWLAAHHPERVRSLTALSIPHLAAFGHALRHDPDQRALSAYISTFRRPGVAEAGLLGDDAAGLREIFAGRVASAAVERDVAVMVDGAMTPALQWYRAMGDLSDLPTVEVPTTYLWGEEDQACGAVAARSCGEHVDGEYRFVPLAGVGHWSPDEVPDLVAEEVLRRVGSVPPA